MIFVIFMFYKHLSPFVPNFLHFALLCLFDLGGICVLWTVSCHVPSPHELIAGTFGK